MRSLVEMHSFIENTAEVDSHIIPANAIDELLAASVFLTIATTNIRAPVSTCISAIHATVHRAGACQAFVPQKLANMCFRRGESRGEYTRLRWTDLETRGRPSKMRLPGPDIDSFMAALKWESPLVTISNSQST